MSRPLGWLSEIVNTALAPSAATGASETPTTGGASSSATVATPSASPISSEPESTRRNVSAGSSSASPLTATGAVWICVPPNGALPNCRSPATGA